MRATAARIIDAVLSDGRSLDAAIADLEIDVVESDRPLLRLLSYGVLRHRWRLESRIDALLDRPLKKRDSIIWALLAAGLYQLSETRIPDHAVVSQTVEAARLLRRPRHASLVNAILRRAIRDRIFENEPSDREAVFNHPQWLLDALERDWPEDWRDIVAANNDRAPMWLRVNPAHGSAEDYVRRLEAEGVEAELMAGLPQAVRLAEPQAVAALPGFSEGHVSVQDAAAQIAALWFGDSIKGRVLDACAAPGGKSGHLLELAGGRIDLTCVDSDESRLADVAETLDRLGFSATLIAADASKPSKWWDGRSFDAILLDAPCSATGVIRRHPDIKSLRRPGDIEALSSRQTALLDALWALLAKGGRLVYATCSVLAAENDETVGAFLGRTDNAQEDEVLQDYNIRDLMRDKACGHQILPGTAGLDGFYYASLVKVS